MSEKAKAFKEKALDSRANQWDSKAVDTKRPESQGCSKERKKGRKDFKASVSHAAKKDTLQGSARMESREDS